MISKTYAGTNKKGKKILIIGSVHGNELTPSDAISELEKNIIVREVIPLDTYKSITTLKWVNSSGIVAGTRDMDETSTNDLNRQFQSENNVSELGWDHISDYIRNQIRLADIVIDVHSSPYCRPMALLNMDETTNSYADFCEESDLTYAIRYNANPTIKKYCIESGKIGFTVELNGIGSIDHMDMGEGYSFLKRILVAVIEKPPVAAEPEPIYPVMYEFKSYKSGIFYPEIDNKANVWDGDCIGHVVDIEKDIPPARVIYRGPAGKIILNAVGYISPNEPCLLVQPNKNIKYSSYVLPEHS